MSFDPVSERPSHGIPRSPASGTDHDAVMIPTTDRPSASADAPTAKAASMHSATTHSASRTMTVAISSVQSTPAPKWYGVRNRPSATATTPHTPISTRNVQRPGLRDGMISAAASPTSSAALSSRGRPARSRSGHTSPNTASSTGFGLTATDDGVGEGTAGDVMTGSIREELRGFGSPGRDGRARPPR